jgi:hypothetical protein
MYWTNSVAARTSMESSIFSASASVNIRVIQLIPCRAFIKPWQAVRHFLTKALRIVFGPPGCGCQSRQTGGRGLRERHRGSWHTSGAASTRTLSASSLHASSPFGSRQTSSGSTLNNPGLLVSSRLGREGRGKLHRKLCALAFPQQFTFGVSEIVGGGHMSPL